MIRALVAGLLWLLAATAIAQDDSAGSAGDANQAATPSQNRCLADAVREAPPGTTVESLRAWCHEQELTGRERNEHAIRERLMLEQFTQYNPFVITPHHRNYLLPFSYWTRPLWNDPARADDPIDHYEAKFQLSIKMPLMDNIFGNSTLYGAFTSVSYWQVYNDNASKPFRETNYQPELFLARPVDWQFGPIDSELLTFGYMHQSNGQDVPTSRSWERLFMTYVFRSGPYYFEFRPWWRIPENKKSDPLDPNGDDNPDIEDYMGHFELTASRPYGHQVVELMVRNNLKSENHGAAQLNYSFPLSKRFKGLVQVFTGYGDSLINYNNYENRYSFGILLTDSL